MRIVIESEALADLVRKEAVKLLNEGAKKSARFVSMCYKDWKPSYPYGQFNKAPAAMYDMFEKDLTKLKTIYDVELEEYFKKLKDEK